MKRRTVDILASGVLSACPVNVLRQTTELVLVSGCKEIERIPLQERLQVNVVQGGLGPVPPPPAPRRRLRDKPRRQK